LCPRAVYTDKTFPLSAGFVAIIDRNAVTTPANWQQCLTGQPRASAQAVTLQPCATTFTLKKDNNEFYIAYVATTVELCQALCSRLEGCQPWCVMRGVWCRMQEAGCKLASSIDRAGE
jgi:hypothetical protein